MKILSALLISALFATGSWAATTELDRLVAVVNDEAIAMTELNQEMTNVKLQMQSQRRPLPSDEVLSQQVLERLVMKHIQSQLAASNNIIVDDDTLNRAVGRIAEQNKLSLTEFRQVLLKDGIDFNQFREQIRHEILSARLRQRFVDNRINITEAEVDQFINQQKKQGNSKDQYYIDHILVSTPEAASVEQIKTAREKALALQAKIKNGTDFAELAVANSDGQKALEGGDWGWRTAGQLPTLFANIVAEMKVGDVSNPIRSPSGFHLIRLRDYKGDTEQRLITQTHARHILIKTDALVSDDDAAAKLAQLKERIEDGDDFGELAKAHSADKGSAAGGGDLGWATPGQMVPRFEAAMNALQPGEISDPFLSQFGWHIVQVLERRQHDETDEFRHNQARKQLVDRKINEEEELWLRRLRDEAYVELHL